MSWVNTVLDAAQRLGLERDALLEAAGIAPAQMTRDRWPVDQITRLWCAAARTTGDPGFGLKAGALVGPASFNAVGYLLQSAPTLRESIAVVQKYQRLISDGGRLQMIPGTRSSWLVYHPRQGKLPFSPHQIEAVLASVVAFAHWVSGRFLRPLKVQFSQSSIGPMAGYQAAFQCPVEFDQAFSGVLIDNTVLDTPLPQADAQLARVHQQYAAARLAALSPPEALAQDLRRWIDSQLYGQVPTRSRAAQALGLTPRTLARRMQQQQLDFSGLLDEARRDAALHAVANTAQALADIGQGLGFAEPSTFWRAFKRWTGVTPAQWRRQAAAGAAALLDGE